MVVVTSPFFAFSSFLSIDGTWVFPDTSSELAWIFSHTVGNHWIFSRLFRAISFQNFNATSLLKIFIEHCLTLAKNFVEHQYELSKLFSNGGPAIKTRILVVETYCVDGISYLGAHVMLSIVNDHLSNKWMKKNIQALYLITVHLK